MKNSEHRHVHVPQRRTCLLSWIIEDDDEFSVGLLRHM